MKPHDELERHKKLRSITANQTDNIYELTRMRIVRVMRECEDVSYAAEELGCSRATVQRYMNFVPFEHLMRDPSLENRFDWRSMTYRKWGDLLRKYPKFITRLPKKRFPSLKVADILIAQPQLAPYFDLSEWNRLELVYCWVELLTFRPEFADQCDFSIVTARWATDLLAAQPQFFDRIPLETLRAYQWTELFMLRPQLEQKMLEKPHSEWPFNFWVHALQYHPELESEFDGWDKIEDEDVPDLKRKQPEMYARHWPKK